MVKSINGVDKMALPLIRKVNSRTIKSIENFKPKIKKTRICLLQDHRHEVILVVVPEFILLINKLPKITCNNKTSSLNFSPLIDKTILEGVTRHSLHDVRFSFLVGK